MKNSKFLILIFTLNILITMQSWCQNNIKGQSEGNINRRAAFAGQFYEGKPDSLRAQLKTLFSEAAPTSSENVLALIAPHAGYVFSGVTAASAFNQIDTKKKYKNIFVITSSHRVSFDGASIYYIGDYETPLGEVIVNKTLAKELVDTYSFFTYRHDAHANEHSLEVQLPFLQYLLGDSFEIIPIVIGTNNTKTIEQISAVLKPYFNDENLFVISTDLSHYPSYENALNADAFTVESVLKNDPDALIRGLEVNEASKTKGLVTSMCGWTSVLTLLNMSSTTPGISIKKVHTSNSGDSKYGDHQRVVGYAAIAVCGDGKTPNNADNKEVDFTLTQEEKDLLIKVVKETLNSYIGRGNKPILKNNDFPASLHAPLGVFVSLYKNKSLRGCIGSFYSDAPLYLTVQEMAIASATQDRRFNPVITGELKDIEVEISVLSPMKRISSPEEIKLGTHGIYIRKGNQSGTFLPQVATQTGWNTEEFLGHCAQDKAGIGWDGWRNAEVYIYTALVFGEK